MNIKTLFDYYFQNINTLNGDDKREMIFYILEEVYHLSKNDFILNLELDAFEEETAKNIVSRLNENEPIQYILENAWFRNRRFYVNKNVLIPRPETEEIIDLAIQTSAKTILDLGTGSGCIAISAALELPNAQVCALDISENALEVAQRNAANLNANVKFELGDILNFKNSIEIPQFELIISNPPYVKDAEKTEMLPNVLNFEPHLALFVSNQNPLLFYEKIAEIATKHLTQNGTLILEINSHLGVETQMVFTNAGFQNVKLIDDFHEKNRFIVAKR